MVGESKPLAIPRRSGDVVAQALREGFAASVSALARFTPVGFAYLGLVLLLWLPLGWKNGMPYETAFPYNSETTSFWHGFLYSDPLRVYTNVFYNLGYHLSAWLGIGGSFLGFQLVYAALWWARGVVAYLIMRALVPGRRALALLVGALVLVHASDHAINWVGQMNQYGMILWTLLAIYMLVLALRASTVVGAGVLTGFAMLFAYLGLWSYESPLFIVLAVPILLLALRFGFTRRNGAIAGAFYVVPLIYMWDNYRRYTTTGASTYQESVVRKDKSLGPMLSDLWFNVKNSLEFWNWGWGLPPARSHTELVWLSVGGGVLAAAIVAGGWLVARRREELAPSRRTLVWLLVSGVVVLVLSFPAYLILTSARQLWRTQFLSGMGAALVLASVVVLALTFVPWRRARVALAAAFAGAVAYYGVAASYTAASFHYGIWQRHRTAMAEVLGVAPRLEPGTLVILTNVPKTADPFGDNMWFDVALRLAYPHDPVAGVYFYSGGGPSPDDGMKVTAGRWVYDNVGFPPLLRNVPLRNTLIVRFSPSGRGTLVRSVPPYLHAAGLAAAYAPTTRIEPGPPPAPARRRYGPIP